MQRCVFLGFRIVHRQEPPRGETRPKQQVHAPPLPWAERNPSLSRRRPSWHRSYCGPPGSNPPAVVSHRAELGAITVPRSHTQPDDQNGRPWHSGFVRTRSLSHRFPWDLTSEQAFFGIPVPTMTRLRRLYTSPKVAFELTDSSHDKKNCNSPERIRLAKYPRPLPVFPSCRDASTHPLCRCPLTTAPFGLVIECGIKCPPRGPTTSPAKRATTTQCSIH
jgi:hypothetical protein